MADKSARQALLKNYQKKAGLTPGVFLFRRF